MWMKKIVVENQGKGNALVSKYSFGSNKQYYVLCFVHAPLESVVLAGWLPEVMEFLISNYSKSMYRLVGWNAGKKVTYPWALTNGNKTIRTSSPHSISRRRHFCFYSDKGDLLHKLRHIPNKWIKEYDDILSLP